MWLYISKSFRTGRLERELQMIQLFATRCSCIAILWVSLVSFAAITLCVATQRVIPKVSAHFIMDSVRKLLDCIFLPSEWESLVHMTRCSQLPSPDNPPSPPSGCDSVSCLVHSTISGGEFLDHQVLKKVCSMESLVHEQNTNLYFLLLSLPCSTHPQLKGSNSPLLPRDWM
jgi:hypothetical protein